MHNKVERAIAFVSGDLLAMVFAWIHLDVMFLLTKLLLTFFLGILGGAGGLVGKDIYRLIKLNYTRICKKQSSKN